MGEEEEEAGTKGEVKLIVPNNASEAQAPDTLYIIPPGVLHSRSEERGKHWQMYCNAMQSIN